jgi:hypothetical protein
LAGKIDKDGDCIIFAYLWFKTFKDAVNPHPTAEAIGLEERNL